MAQSLKEKRRHIKSLIDSMRANFNVSAAEVDYLDKWQRSVIGVTWISHSGKSADSYGSKIENLILSHAGITLLRVEKNEY